MIAEKEKRHLSPPLYALAGSDNRYPKCEKPYRRDKNSIEYRNAITVYLQDTEKFNDIEKITCILLGIDTGNIRVGEKVNVTEDVHIRPKVKNGLLIPKVFSEQLEYVDKEQIATNNKDINLLHN